MTMPFGLMFDLLGLIKDKARTILRVVLMYRVVAGNPFAKKEQVVHDRVPFELRIMSVVAEYSDLIQEIIG